MNEGALRPGALDGIVVADFSRVLAGPYATMLLGDLGADVVKVERPGTGDDTRHWGPPYDAFGRATYFASVNRNKRSVAIDLRTDKGRATAHALALRADVVVHNFVPGTMERFGLGWEQLREYRPDLVYASVTGFGSGAGRDLPGYDLLVQAVGGLMSVTGPDADTPTKAGVALVDVLTGTHCAIGILAALHHRDATGEGQHVEVALLTSLLSALVNQAQSFVGAGVVPGILGNAHPSIAPYETFATGTRPLVVAVGNDGQFARLCAALHRPAWVTDDRYATNPARVEHRLELKADIEAVLAGADADTWWERLTGAGVPCGPINGLDDAVALADRLGLDPVVHPDGAAPGSAADVPTVASPVRMSATPATYRLPPPALGEHTAEVLGDAPAGDPR